MKSSFSLGKQLKKFTLQKTDPKEKKDHHHKTLAHSDALAQASLDMKDMRDCCDSLLSAAAATTNSAYEFSESLLEMGNCLLERAALDKDGECGRALSMLGKLQLELQKLVDGYRSHVILTLTNPSESLLSELRKVEISYASLERGFKPTSVEMKQQCDEKRCIYEHMVDRHSEKGKSRSGKAESVTSQQIQAAHEEYDDVARLCVFRVESLKQGQCRSLLTQAVRHHAAQLSFFRRGLKSLEAVEPYMQNIAQKQHIDYQLNELDEAADGEEDGGNSDDTNRDGEISSVDVQFKQEQENPSTSMNSMEVDPVQADAPIAQVSGDDVEVNFGKKKGEQVFSRKPQVSSHSAPIYADKFDPSEKVREMQTSAQKFHAYVLPTPADARSSNSRTSSSTLHSSTTSVSGSTNNLWHSSPLDAEKPKKFMDDNLSVRPASKAQAVLKDSDQNIPSIPLPSPLAEGISLPRFDTHSGYDAKKGQRQAFSGPLLSKPSSSKPLLSSSGPIGPSELPQVVSGLISRISTSQPPSTLNVTQSVSPPSISSPKISELHELPRPPGSLASKPASSSSVVGHSAPLINRNREASPTNSGSVLASNAGSPLPPPPPLTVPRSFSIPSSNHRVAVLHVTKLLESPEIKEKARLPSPPLTPISLSNMKSTTVVSELASNLGR